MRSIVEKCESPDGKYEIVLKKQFSLFDFFGEETHDVFYLTIRNKHSALKKYFPRKVQVCESHYNPIVTPEGYSLGGTIVDKIGLHPRENDVKIKLFMRSSTRSIRTTRQQTKTISYVEK